MLYLKIGPGIVNVMCTLSCGCTDDGEVFSPCQEHEFRAHFPAPELSRENAPDDDPRHVAVGNLRGPR